MVDYRDRLEAAIGALVDDNIARFDEITADIMRDKVTEVVASVREVVAQEMFDFSGNEVDESEDLDEGQKLVATHKSSDGSKVAKVYRNPEWEEHVVQFHKDGKHQKDADYHTDDKEDAHNTAKHWIGEKAEKN